MTWDRRLYPSNWEQIAHDVKQQAGWHCEECGRPCRKPNVDWGDFIMWLLSKWGPDTWYNDTCDYDSQGEPIEKPTRFVLTVAHLDHNPANCDRANLKALCSVCHLQMDNTPSARFQKRQVKAERVGQLNLLETAQC